MLGWMHLELNFKAIDLSKEAFPQKKPEGSYKELISYLNQVANSVSDLIRRYFFLFEPKPHLFLALEVKDNKNFETIKDKINEIPKPTFIDSNEIKFNTGDENHPEGVLDFFCASTKYAFFRVRNDYRPGYYNNDETKIIHCFCNQLFASPSNELFFLLKCAFNRGILSLNEIIQCLRNSGFPNDITEYLFWDLAKNAVSYKGQRIYVLENNGNFFYLIVYLGKQRGLIGANAPLLTQREAEDRARELIDKNLTSGVWTIKPVT